MVVLFNHHDNFKKKQRFNTEQLHFVTQTLPGYCYWKQPHKPVNETDSLK